MPAKAPQGWFVDMSTDFGAYYPKIGSYLHQNWCAYPRTTPLVPLLACLAPKFLTVYGVRLCDLLNKPKIPQGLFVLVTYSNIHRAGTVTN